MDFDAAVMRMTAMRQGLQYGSAAKFEMGTRRGMVEVDNDFRWHLSPSLKAWIADNAVGEVYLRFDARNRKLLLCAEDETDLTMIATAF